MMEQLRPLGLEMSTRLAKALTGGDLTRIEGFGKGAIVGAGGELEHGALWHVPGGYAMRDLLGSAKAIVPSTKKVGGPGAHITLPITNKDDIWSFDEMDAIDVWIPDAPRPAEIVVSVALAVGGRPFARTRKPS
jgi:hypothetical protein